MSTQQKKGLVLLSGGLDSTLAAKLMLEQGIELEGINFYTSFHTHPGQGYKDYAKKASRDLGIGLRRMEITEEQLEIIKNPRHGYGSNVNPCIDCRIFMFKKARDYMEEIGASFMVTGEVVGERPMSQRLDAIRLIEKEAGLKGLVVRPLSAKLLEPSLAEKEGVVDRDKLLDIQGRSRKPQMELAEELDISDYPNPAGGCLLTEPGFAKRARDLLEHGAFTLENIHLLKAGRHFRLDPKSKLVVGRNRDENERLLKMAKRGDIFFDPKDIPGPIGLLRGEDVAQDFIEASCSIVLRYSDTRGCKNGVIYWRHPNGTRDEIVTSPAPESMLSSMRI